MPISYEVFKKLKRGDVVLYNGRPRVVQLGPADYEPEAPRRPGRGYSERKWRRRALYVTFAILRRSWTNRGHTGYCWNDVKRFLSLPRRPLSTAVVTRQELRHLMDLGFDPRKEFEDEKAFHLRLQKFRWSRRLISRCTAINPPERKP